jgi:hypothetical protein
LAGGKMHLNKNLKSGATATLIVRRSTKDRLRTTCFRGTSLKKAGNFFRWNSVEGFFQDGLVLEKLLTEIDYLFQVSDFRTHRMHITHTQPVGWGSTGIIDNYPSDALEHFNPNRRSTGLRVKSKRIDILAPMTQELTIVFEFKSEDSCPTAIVHSIYPGTDVGELMGDVTEREQLIFFDWNHPGEN